jgi:hypothetical protein
MLKKVLTAVVVCSAVALFLPSSASALILCDNFGREWDVTLTTCADADTGKCANGFRDINNELGCGPLPVFGTLVAGVLSVSALDTPDDTCVTVAWRGSYDGVQVSGSFESELLATGSFTLGACSPEAPQDNNANIALDPQVRH